ISGLAPMFVPGSQKVRVVLGIDMSASTYWQDIALAAAIPLFVSLSISMLIIVFESLRRRNNQLMNVRSELVSVASHELRTPIVGIRWASEGLVRLITDENAKKLVQAIKNSADGLQASTDDILELSHAMTRRDLNPQPVDLTVMVKEIMDTQRLTAQQKNVRLVRDASWPDELLVTCDANKMKRVLHNVISNCIKYTRENTEITTSYSRDKHMHHIHIADQGIGIPKGEQSKVMKGFYRASNAVASKVPGTGLGLYLVKTVLEQHGGSVRFDSEENKGTVVTLSLPG
ncbi:MAG TPA: HAMP domain-containing sensor histidine kinase, partial [Candidatus Saccharimonadales bacterium]|nr:HAMP domain-containing sensor histidine kinase [Candidatus Saccharimonadales bacterium]